MKLPRDLSGRELAKMLEPCGYRVTRQVGSHLRLTSTARGKEHHITVPAHMALRVGTLSGVLSEVASYLEIDRNQLAIKLFGA
ncbi:MAG: type II toxin-antitoxin system HicA family toxin [Terriglobales bacterium]